MKKQLSIFYFKKGKHIDIGVLEKHTIYFPFDDEKCDRKTKECELLLDDKNNPIKRKSLYIENF